MKTKFKSFALFACVLAGIVVVFWHTGRRRAPAAENIPPGEPPQKSRSQLYQEIHDRAPSMTIYGKVVDTDGEPIPGVEVEFAVKNLNYLLGLPYHSRVRPKASNLRGEFQFTIEKPRFAGLQSVTKPGYVYKREFESGGNYVSKKSTSENRVLIRMRKLGTPTFLLELPPNDAVGKRLFAVKGGESTSRKWSVTNLETYQAYWNDARDLEVIALFDEEAKDWEVTFRALSRGGGLVLSKSELFMAPADGYQQEVSFRTGGIGTDSSSRQSQYYLYMKSRGPVLYTKLRVYQLIGQPRQYPQSDLDIAVKSWTNPYGERNFEPMEEATVGNYRAIDAHTEYCLQCINEGRRADPKHLADLLAKPPASP